MLEEKTQTMWNNFDLPNLSKSFWNIFLSISLRSWDVLLKINQTPAPSMFSKSKRWTWNCFLLKTIHLGQRICTCSSKSIKQLNWGKSVNLDTSSETKGEYFDSLIHWSVTTLGWAAYFYLQMQQHLLGLLQVKDAGVTLNLSFASSICPK